MSKDQATNISLLLLRVTFGGLMLINHGWGKMLKLFGEGPIKFGDPLGVGVEASLGLAVFAEVVCAFLLVIGLFTRWASVPALITMLVAAFIVHSSDPFGDKEAALLFAVPYAVLMLMGAGRYSVDGLLEQRRMA
jgi:putative oxidoreductase